MNPGRSLAAALTAAILLTGSAAAAQPLAPDLRAIAQRLELTAAGSGRWLEALGVTGSTTPAERLIALTLETQPEGATHWSTRSMAQRTGLSQTMVSRIWRAFGLRPHRHETFKLSSDPAFVDKVRDVIGLYLSPPARALVLCVDEKPQIQAVERTAPVLPMRPAQVERRTHDYKRHGTTDLFAALDVKAGTVIGAHQGRPAQRPRLHRGTRGTRPRDAGACRPQ